MKTSLLISSLVVSLAPCVFAADTPLLAIPGKVVYESKLDTAPSDPWKAAKGKWEAVGGVLRGAEKPEDKHGAVNRYQTKLADFVIEYEFKFEGAKSTSLTVNAVKDHMARISMTPQSVTIQKDDNDHDGPDKAVVFARFPADLKPGTWHTVRMEMVGDTMLGKVDDLIAWGSNDLFKQDRMAPGFTVGGEFVDFRNIKISEATLNPEWTKVQATLPKPGEKVEAVAAKASAKKAE
ncbi:MAG: family 16 glycoside hydrolase [Verrucomicrobiota bacterium]